MNIVLKALDEVCYFILMRIASVFHFLFWQMWPREMLDWDYPNSSPDFLDIVFYGLQKRGGYFKRDYVFHRTWEFLEKNKVCNHQVYMWGSKQKKRYLDFLKKEAV